LEGSEVLLVEKVGENLLVNFKVKCTMLHREDVDEVVEDLFLNEIVNPILPSFLLLVDWGLKDDRGQDIVDLFELLIYKKIVKVAIFCLFEYFFWDL